MRTRRRNPAWAVLVPAAIGLASLTSAPALEYPTHAALTQRLRQVERAHPQLVRLGKLAESRGRREVWLVALGHGPEAERAARPALLVVAGLEGNDLAGSVSALAWLERLAAGYAQEPATRDLLDRTTLYVIPRFNPDAAEHFFASPKVEVATSLKPVDDDRDGLTDEDGPDDLDGDGRITWMRLPDPEGEYILDPTEPRLLLRADKSKGESGAWRFLSEGKDNDQDRVWNEDGAGGVNFNRNFPFHYRFFVPDAGEFPVSEPETKALADFIVAHPAIGLVFSFGAADNLVQTPKSEPGGKKPPTALHEGDLPFYRELGRAWRETLGLKKELSGSTEPGTFADWIYFHRGRLALTTRAWSPALQLELAKGKSPAEKQPAPEDKPAEKAEENPESDKPARPDADSRNEADRAFLKWIDAHAPEGFVSWTAVQHPDFPDRKVEVGGFAPFARSNPPEPFLAEWAEKHARFLTTLAGKLPRVGIRKAEARPLGESVYEVIIQVENTGYLPTALAQGSLTREVYPTRVVLGLDEAAFLAGSRTTPLGPIEGSGGMREARWIVRAKGRKRLEFEVISMLGGTVRAGIPLEEGK